MLKELKHTIFEAQREYLPHNINEGGLFSEEIGITEFCRIIGKEIYRNGYKACNNEHYIEKRKEEK